MYNCIIYLLTSPSNKYYIGYTTRPLADRVSEHVRSSVSGSEYPLHCAIRKYGIDSFDISCVESFDTDDINFIFDKEIHWISTYDSFNNGYNCTIGGGGFLGGNHSESTLRLFSEQRSGINHPLYGKHHSDETKNKISLKARKRLSIPSNNPMYGRSHSESSKQLISDKAMGNTRYRKGVYLIDPIGDDYVFDTINEFKEFCKSVNISYDELRRFDGRVVYRHSFHSIKQININTIGWGCVVL